MTRRRAAIDTVTDIDTPERVRFSFRLAGPGQRAAAYLIDLLVRAAALFLIVLGATGAELGGSDLVGVGVGVGLIAAFVLEWGYYVISETLMAGQSIGKRALGLRVVQSGGLPIGFGESALRNLLRAADFLPTAYALGAAIMALEPKFRRLGDMVAGTLVISEQRDAVLPPIEVQPAPTLQELRQLPLRVSLSPEELGAIEQFLRRRTALSNARAEELANLVAPLFAARLGVTYSDPVRFLALVHHRATRPGATA